MKPKPLNLASLEWDVLGETLCNTGVYVMTKDVGQLRKTFPTLRFSYVKDSFDNFYHVHIAVDSLLHCCFDEIKRLKKICYEKA